MHSYKNTYTKENLTDAYREYVQDCQALGHEHVNYRSWLESFLTGALGHIETLAEDLRHYQHAADINHAVYMSERRRRETYEASLVGVLFALNSGDYDHARFLVNLIAIHN